MCVVCVQFFLPFLLQEPRSNESSIPIAIGTISAQVLCLPNGSAIVQWKEPRLFRVRVESRTGAGKVLNEVGIASGTGK